MTFKTSPYTQSMNQHLHSLVQPSDRSVDIEFFKRSISLHYQHLYATSKWRNWAYRTIFFGFSILFFIFSMMIFFKTTNHISGHYFANSAIVVKNWVNIACILFAGGAFFLGYNIHPEKEAIKCLVGKVVKELNHPTKQLQIEFNAIFANLSHFRFE